MIAALADVGNPWATCTSRVPLVSYATVVPGVFVAMADQLTANPVYALNGDEVASSKANFFGGTLVASLLSTGVCTASHTHWYSLSTSAGAGYVNGIDGHCSSNAIGVYESLTSASSGKVGQAGACADLGTTAIASSTFACNLVLNLICVCQATAKI